MDPCDLTELILIEMHVPMNDELLKSKERRVHEDGDNAARAQEVERPADIGEISEVSLRNPDAVVAYTKTALPIRLGQLTGIPDKAALTQDFLRDQKTTRHTVEYVDFSYDAPFIKLADKTAEGK